MSHAMKALQGTVEEIIFCDDETGYTVLQISSQGECYTAVGSMAQICIGEEVTLYGHFADHPSFGRQLCVNFFKARPPKTTAAIKQYLASGVLPHIRYAMAEKIVAMFGDDTIQVIANEPMRLTQLQGMTMEKAQAVSEELKHFFGVREAINYFASYQLPASAAVALYHHYGSSTVELLRENPYLICAYPANLDFVFADEIAHSMQMEKDAYERVAAGVCFVMRHNLTNGHTCLPVHRVCKATADFLEISQKSVQEVIEQLVEYGRLYRADCLQGSYLYLPEYWQAERFIAEYFHRLAELPSAQMGADDRIKEIESKHGIDYAPLQKQAIQAALNGWALILTGGPGTGKTTAVNAILELFEQEGRRVALAAPTGRAVKRLSELTGHTAKTLHRLLEADPNGTASQTRFLYNEKNKLSCDVVIIDEMSMVDVLLFKALLAALKPHCKIILVGDENQLLSVGAGCVLEALLESKTVPAVRLKTIFRQAAKSMIVSNAHHIIEGVMPCTNNKNSDFFFLERKGRQCAQLVCDLAARRLPGKYRYHPLEDIQVLCPSKKGQLGTVELNRMLQACLNPEAENKPQIKVGNTILRTGDKVMQTRNNYDIPFVRLGSGEDGVGALNGDLGVIEQVDVREAIVTVRCDDRRLTYTGEFLRELEPAYAITIHKSQGSEFPVVIIPVSDVPSKLCYRNLLYTAVTRAKSLCILIGERCQVYRMVNNKKASKRFSCLADFLREESREL